MHHTPRRVRVWQHFAITTGSRPFILHHVSTAMLSARTARYSSTAAQAGNSRSLVSRSICSAIILPKILPRKPRRSSPGPIATPKHTNEPNGFDDRVGSRGTTTQAYGKPCSPLWFTQPELGAAMRSLELIWNSSNYALTREWLLDYHRRRRGVGDENARRDLTA